MSRIKAFFETIQNEHIRKNLPSVFTEENINITYKSITMQNVYGDDLLTILEFLVTFINAYDAVKEALDLGAKITPTTIQYSRLVYYELLLEKGLDPNCLIDGTTPLMNYALFYKICDATDAMIIIDFGGRIPKKWTRIANAPMLRELEQYALLSNTRVTTSRKSLCALLWCVRNGLFPALRGIIVELTRVAWAQRGGEGCGPRGALWGQ